MNSMQCASCKVGTLSVQRRRRMPGAIVFLGFVILVPSLIGVVLSALFAAVVYLGGSLLDKVQTNMAHDKVKVDQLHHDVELYQQKHHQLPAELDVLAKPDPMNDDQPWVKPDELVNSWQEHFVLKKSTQPDTFEVISSAPPAATQTNASADVDLTISSARPLPPIFAADHDNDETSMTHMLQILRPSVLIFVVVFALGVVLAWFLIRKRAMLVCDRCGVAAPAP